MAAKTKTTPEQRALPVRELSINVVVHVVDEDGGKRAVTAFKSAASVIIRGDQPDLPLNIDVGPIVLSSEAIRRVERQAVEAPAAQPLAISIDMPGSLDVRLVDPIAIDRVPDEPRKTVKFERDPQGRIKTARVEAEDS